jgi:hypothetical protein
MDYCHTEGHREGTEGQRVIDFINFIKFRTKINKIVFPDYSLVLCDFVFGSL